MPYLFTSRKFFSRVPLLSWLAFHSANSQELVFKDPILISGIDGKDHAVYRFAKVNARIDALVIEKMRFACNVSNGNMDVNILEWNKAF